MKSKFSIAQAVIIPAYLFLVSFGVTALLLFAGVNALRKSGNGIFLLFGFGLVFLVMSLLIVRHYLRILNAIEIDLDGIAIKGLLKRKTIAWDEVENINLTGKEPENFMFTSMPMEAVSILTKDGLKEVILLKYYSNMDRIRTALHFINLKIASNEKISSECFLHVQRTEPSIPNPSGLHKFGGNHLITFNGLITYGCIALAVWLFVFSNSPMPIFAKVIMLIILLLFGPGFYGYQLHYFRLNDEYLVVRNHLWFWRDDAYLIKDIREIVFEEPHKMSTSLRVITNNYESKLYPAGSIRKKSWRKLKKELTVYGVKVRNEAYFE